MTRKTNPELKWLRWGRASEGVENPAHSCPMRDAFGPDCNKKRRAFGLS
jgi:hypothetical protein